MKRTLIALIALAGALVAAIALADIRGTWTIEKSSRHDDRVQLNLSREHNNFGSTFLLSSFTGLSLADGASNFELRAEAGTVRFDGTFRDGDGAGHFTFTPNSAFVNTLRSMNVPGIGEVDDEKLLELALHGVSTDFIRSMRAEGYDVTLDKYVGMRIFNVTPAVIQELRTLGFDRLKYDDLIASRIHGVTPEFIRKMAALGYHHIDLDDLVAMRIHGVTPKFIRELKDAGYEGVPVDKLVSMRIHGIDAAFIRKVK